MAMGSKETPREIAFKLLQKIIEAPEVKPIPLHPYERGILYGVYYEFTYQVAPDSDYEQLMKKVERTIKHQLQHKRTPHPHNYEEKPQQEPVEEALLKELQVVLKIFRDKKYYQMNTFHTDIAQGTVIGLKATQNQERRVQTTLNTLEEGLHILEHGEPSEEEAGENKLKKYLIPILAAALLILVVWFFLPGGNENGEADPATEPTSPVSEEEKQAEED